MQDDFAPRPCRCFAAIVVAVVFFAVASVFAVLAGSLWSERDHARAELVEANATIDELRTIIRAHEATPYVLPDGELEPGKMGGRIIPETKETIARVQELLEKFDRLLEDVKAGRVGVEIDGSIMRGHAEAKLKRNP